MRPGGSFAPGQNCNYRQTLQPEASARSEKSGSNHRRTSGESLYIPFRGIGSNREFLELLRENKVRTIHSQEATLEEVFIKLTGDTLL